MDQNFVVKVKKLSPTAIIPTYGSPSAAGADLYANVAEDTVIEYGKTMKIKTGIAMEIPEGYVGLIFARSGLSCKHGLAPANKVGVIDSDYRGEIMVALHNHELPTKLEEEVIEYRDKYIERHTIHPGDRIAQISIIPFKRAQFVLSEDLSDTSRLEGGCGRTGMK